MAAVFAAIALLVIAFWMWHTRTGGVMGVQLLIRLLAVIAALRGWRAAMVLLFACGFVPIGMYFLGAPSYVAAAGVADLLYLATTAALVVKSRRSHSAGSVH